MNEEKLEVAPIFISDWFGSEAIAAMSAEEEVLYMRLLLRCWQRGSLPLDEGQLCRLAVVERGLFDRAWPAVSRQFFESEGRLRNVKVEEKRSDYLRVREINKDRAKRAAEKRWNAPSNAPSIAPSIARAMPKAMLQAVLEQCPTDASSSSSIDKKEKVKKDSGGAARARACAKEDLDQIAFWCSQLRGCEAVPDARLCRKVWEAGGGDMSRIESAISAAAAAGTGKRMNGWGLVVSIVADWTPPAPRAVAVVPVHVPKCPQCRDVGVLGCSPPTEGWSIKSSLEACVSGRGSLCACESGLWFAASWFVSLPRGGLVSAKESVRLGPQTGLPAVYEARLGPLLPPGAPRTIQEAEAYMEQRMKKAGLA